MSTKPVTNYAEAFPIIGTFVCDGRVCNIRSSVHATWEDAQMAIARRTKPLPYTNATTPAPTKQQPILEELPLSA